MCEPEKGRVSKAPVSVDILMATYNGECYVAEQIESIIAQDYNDWQLLVSDDCSTDETLAILHEFERRDVRIKIVSAGVRQGGSCENFMSLLVHSKSDYVFFCDQDDVWLPGRLKNMLEAMQDVEKQHGKEEPCLVFTDLVVVDDHLGQMAPSFNRYANFDPSRISLNQLLGQNVVTGCAMAFNGALREKALGGLDGWSSIVMHDWWLALVASVCGTLTYLDKPTALYRQHSNNQIGARKFTNFVKPQQDFFERYLDAFYGRYTKQACMLLQCHSSDMDVANLTCIRAFIDLQKTSGLKQLATRLQYGFWQNSLRRKAGMLFFTVFYGNKAHKYWMNEQDMPTGQEKQNVEAPSSLSSSSLLSPSSYSSAASAAAVAAPASSFPSCAADNQPAIPAPSVQFFAVDVIYNRRCTDSPSLETLLAREDVTVIICDNSEGEPETIGKMKSENALFAERHGALYLDMEGNKGLSYAYNRAYDFLSAFEKPRAYENSFYCIFDDDTVVPSEYFDFLRHQASCSQAGVFLPIVFDELGHLLSPCRVNGWDFAAFASKSELNDAMAKREPLSGINSGMAIRFSMLEITRWDERLFLDFVDHAFLQGLRTCDCEFAIMKDVELAQAFSNNTATKDASLARFRIYCKDAHSYYGQIETRAAVRFCRRKLFLRACRLSVRYKTAAFMKVLLGL